MTDEELKALVAENSRAVVENSRSILEMREEIGASRQEAEKRWAAWQQESDRLWQEIRVSRQDTDRLITGIHRELRGIGKRLGGQAESMLRPSLERAMREQLKVPVITSPQRARRYDESLEIDMVAHAGDESDEVYLVEMKSRLTEAAFDQLASWPPIP